MDRKQYNDLLEPLVGDKKSPFYKQPRTGVYIVSASLGFKNKSRKKTQNPIDVRLFSQLSNEEKWALFTIAIATEGTTDALLDGEKTIKTVEEYANGGVQILYDKLFKEKLNYSLENEIINIIEKAKI